MITFVIIKTDIFQLMIFKASNISAYTPLLIKKTNRIFYSHDILKFLIRNFFQNISY